jgi:CHAT domain-containing protein/Tfp pilus assembly protein PilF
MTQLERFAITVMGQFGKLSRHQTASLPILLLFFSFITAISPRQAFGAALFRQSIQQSRDTGSDEKDVRALEPGKPVRRDLAGGQEHTYRIELNADQFLKVIVEQQWIDVVAQVSGPDGNQLLEFDSESRLYGREEVSLVTGEAGGFLLIVRPKLNVASAGGYEIRIEELRGATDTDRALQDALKQYKEGLKMRSAGNYDGAFQFAQRALEIRERLLGTEHPDVAESVENLADIYSDKGEYASAEPLYLRALAICEKSLGEDHPRTSQSLNNLAFLYDYQRKYREAEALYQRSLNICEKALGKDHLETAIRLNNLATLYFSQGKYVEAEPLYLRVLEIREKALGKDHSSYATILSNLAGLYYLQGKFVKAEPLYLRALEIREKTLGKNHPSYATTLSKLATLYYLQERYVEAEPLYLRVLNIREKVLGKDHPFTAESLNSLGLLYQDQGKYLEAEALCKRALEIYEKALGKDHPSAADSLHILARLYHWQGKYDEAEALYNRALAINEKALGEDHPSARAILDNLAALYMAKGAIVQAVKFQSLANAASERNLAYNLAAGSERDKLAYLTTFYRQTDRTISLHIHSAPADPAARKMAATLILQRKGRALDATSQNLNALRSRFNAEDQALLDRWTATRSQIARLVLSGPQSMSAERHQAGIKELEDQADKDESEISRRSKEFFAQSLPVTLEAAQAAIPPDSALIEFASYHPFNARAATYDQAHYVVYVLHHDGKIAWKELGDANSIDDAIAALRNALRDPKRTDVKRLARAVDAKVFQPIRPLLGGKSRLLISPDGSLNLIPFATLVDERMRYVVERYSISYLTSGRDLLRLHVARESKDGPMVVAGPDFGRKRKAAEGEINGESAGSAFRGVYFPPLPGAEQEGEALSALLPGATVLAKSQATKAALSRIHAPKLLHIATHGFFLEDLDMPSTGGRGHQSFTGHPERILRDLELDLERHGARIESPLLRSGLALAGANEHREDDNGILTALEVTGLNLWGTKLVVLSACDTGVGEVKNGDGVYGLRRALALAGSETQVMSLWAISDKATRELMVSYYRKLQNGQGRGEALRQVQLEMLKQANRRHPYFWASFIQSGEWASLDGK